MPRIAKQVATPVGHMSCVRFDSTITSTMHREKQVRQISTLRNSTISYPSGLSTIENDTDNDDS